MRSRIPATLVLLLLVGAGSSGRGLAAQTSVEVSGLVRAQGGASLSGVRVTLEPASPATETDVAGRFALVLPPTRGRERCG